MQSDIQGHLPSPDIPLLLRFPPARQFDHSVRSLRHIALAGWSEMTTRYLQPAVQENNMKQQFTTYRRLAVAAMLTALALVAWAVNPHFLSATASLEADGDADVCFREAGLGDNQNINYLASAQASATFYCVNNGGKCPNAANKTATSGLVSTPATISSGKNGSVPVRMDQSGRA